MDNVTKTALTFKVGKAEIPVDEDKEGNPVCIALEGVEISISSDVQLTTEYVKACWEAFPIILKTVVSTVKEVVSYIKSMDVNPNTTIN